MILDEKSKYKSWSNLKKQMNDLLCDSLKDKISYFYTSYHDVHNAYGRATINYMKKEMVVFSWVEMYEQEYEVSQLLRESKLVSKDYASDCVALDVCSVFCSSDIKGRFLPPMQTLFCRTSN